MIDVVALSDEVLAESDGPRSQWHDSPFHRVLQIKRVPNAKSAYGISLFKKIAEARGWTVGDADGFTTINGKTCDVRISFLHSDGRTYQWNSLRPNGSFDYLVLLAVGPHEMTVWRVLREDLPYCGLERDKRYQGDVMFLKLHRDDEPPPYLRRLLGVNV